MRGDKVLQSALMDDVRSCRKIFRSFIVLWAVEGFNKDGEPYLAVACPENSCWPREVM